MFLSPNSTFLSIWGINTGLGVTGEMDMEEGTHGVSGDTINLVVRLNSLGKEGDETFEKFSILVKVKEGVPLSAGLTTGIY